MASTPPEDLSVPPGHLCGICFQPMLDPVCTQWGHTYDRACIEHWFGSGGRTDPKDGRVLDSTAYVANIALRQAVEAHLSSLEPFRSNPHQSWARLIKEHNWEERSSTIAHTRSTTTTDSSTSGNLPSAPVKVGGHPSEPPHDSAEPETRETQFALAERYREGKDGVPQDLTEALMLYLTAAQQGHVGAKARLGWCFFHGEGVAQDVEEALLWYRKAAAQGHPGAQNSVGWCFYHGKSVERDKRTAVRWFRQAAVHGHPMGQLNLAFCLWHGEGVAEDRAEAAKWYRAAEAQGCHASRFACEVHQFRLNA